MSSTNQPDPTMDQLGTTPLTEEDRAWLPWFFDSIFGSRNDDVSTVWVRTGDAFLNNETEDLAARAMNVEQAIGAYESALRAMTPQQMPKEWARANCKLSNAYLLRCIGDRAYNADRAIDVCRDALSIVAGDMLNDVLFGRGDRVTAFVVNPPGLAELFDQLSVAYMERVNGDRVTNDEIALRAILQSIGLTSRTDEPLNWAARVNCLANRLAVRTGMNRQENIQRSIGFYNQAADVYVEQSDRRNWAAVVTGLATAHFHLHVWLQGDERAESIERAIVLYKQALTVGKQSEELFRWQSATLGLANAYGHRERGVVHQNLTTAIRLSKRVLRTVSPESPRGFWIEAMHNIGSCYARRAMLDLGSFYATRSKYDYKRAISTYKQLLGTDSLAFAPEFRLNALGDLADVYFHLHHWKKAEPAFAEAISIADQLLQTAIYDAGRKSQVRVAMSLFMRHVYCLVRLGKFDEALVQLEASKTRLLALALAVSTSRLESLDPDLGEAIRRQGETIKELEALREQERKSVNTHRTMIDDTWFGGGLVQARAELKRLLLEVRTRYPDSHSLNSLSLPEILALIPDDAALVAPVFSSQGSAVFIIPHGVATITAQHVLHLNDDTAASLETILRGAEDHPGWLIDGDDGRGYLGSTKDPITIDAATAALWDSFVGGIATRLLKSEGRHIIRQIIILPAGGINVLPLHAAWRSVNNERRYLCDDFEVVYAPSAYALDAARRQSAGQGSNMALIAGVSQYECYNDLPYAGLEAKLVARLFGSEPLLDPSAKAETIKKRVKGVSYLHLACHGAFGWQSDPLASSLYLADDEPLSLNDILGQLNLTSVRLATLSACETGVTDVINSPDEFFGLTAGLMQAGATGVVSSLWKVNDRSTALLMERFYQNHLEEDMTPPAALREAQAWLRCVSAGELRERFRVERGKMDADRTLSYEEANAAWWHFASASMPPECHPFASPFYWAAFIYSGA